MEYIRVEDVSLSIKNTTILNHISVELERSEIHGFVGRNGSGKTMLMKCICGFVKPSSGKIIVDQKEIGKDIDFPESMGCIIETPGFISYYTGLHNLKMLAGLNKKIERSDIARAMELVGLDPMLKQTVGKYSLGMRQRLGIAQAIMEKPDLLVLDEPFNGLDQESVEEMRDLFLSLKEHGTTIILCSHTKEDIDILCSHCYEMSHGEMKKLY